MKDIKNNPDESINTEDVAPKDKRDKKCIPSVEFDGISCYLLEVLIEMVKAYNETNPNKKIELKPKLEILNPRKYKKYLIKKLDEITTDKCDGSQKCWSSMDFIKLLDDKMQLIVNELTFRPDGPEGQFTWLNTFDIVDLMSQYSMKYPDFMFLGAVPLDFLDLPELNIPTDFKKLEDDGIHRIGLVINFDKHNSSGSHWVSLFSDLKKGQIYYSDSYATKPLPEIRKYMRMINKYMKNKGMSDSDIHLDYNKVRKQKDGSECGVYSVNWIIRLLKGIPFDELEKELLPDAEVNKCREIYFADTILNKDVNKDKCE